MPAVEQEESDSSSEEEEEEPADITVEPDEGISLIPSPPATAGCGLSVNIKCLPEDGSDGTSCDVLPFEEVPECDVQPHQLIFTFKGGICNTYMSPQDHIRFMCQDFGSGPAMSKSETNYIEAMPPRKVGDLYFEGTVQVGDKFTVVDTEVEGDPIDEEILVLVYEDDTKVNLLQMMVFHTKCEDDLDLGDRYGSLALTAFANEDGEASVYKNVTYEVTVKNTGTNPIRIQHALSIADNEAKDMFAGMGGPLIGAGGEEAIMQVMEIDPTHGRTVSTSVTISGHDDNLSTCAAFDEMLIAIPGPGSS